MTKTINLAALLGVAGGLAAATLPATARANCSPSAAGGYSTPSGGAGPERSTANPRKLLDDGLAAYSVGKFREARFNFDEVLLYAPKEPQVQYLAGAARLRLGDYKGARKLLEKAVAASPNFLIAQQDLAVAYAKTGARDQAQAMLAKLQAMADQCHGSCDEAEPLLAAVTAITEAMATPA